MKNKRNLLGGSLIVILVTFMLVALIFALQTQAQEVTVNDDENSPTGASTKTELVGGSWVLTDVKSNVYNRGNVTKWESASNEITGMCSWKDILDIVHTVSSGFMWQQPPTTMRPGNFLNLDAKYINNEYSTTAKLLAGIKMYIDKPGSNYLINTPDAIEVVKVSKDNKQYSSEDKKGFFNAPKTFFDETNQCELVVDCFIGQDHYVTRYIYTYQP